MGSDPAAPPTAGDALTGASGQPASQALDAANEGFSLAAIGGATSGGAQGPMAMDADAKPSPGSLDGSFGSGGSASFALTSAGLECINFSVVDSEGRVLVADQTTTGTEQIRRYFANGGANGSFGQDNGYVDLPNGAWLQALAVEPAAGSDPEKTVAVVQDGGSLLVERWADDGSLDLAFNGTGMATLGAGGGGFSAKSVGFYGGEIYVAGNLYTNGYALAAVACFNDQGQVSSFGTGNSLATADLGGGWVSSMAIEPNGDLVLAGCEYDASGSHGALCRFYANGGRDWGFGDPSTGVAE